MFLPRRPSAADIDRFLDHSRALPLSFGAPGLVHRTPAFGRRDEQSVVIGRGDDDFARACAALAAWEHFDIGWVEVFPAHAPIEPGTAVAVLIRHLGFWSLNGARVLERVDAVAERTFGFTYGTLTNHAESGEELFEVSIDRHSGGVTYRICAVSRPQSRLAWLGYPVVHRLQARFRRDSAAAMSRAVRRGRR